LVLFQPERYKTSISRLSEYILLVLESENFFGTLSRHTGESRYPDQNLLCFTSCYNVFRMQLSFVAKMTVCQETAFLDSGFRRNDDFFDAIHYNSVSLSS